MVVAAHEVDLLGFRARVTGPPGLLRALCALMPAPPPWTAGAGAGRAVGFRLHLVGTVGQPAVRIDRDGVTLRTAEGPDEALAFLLWAIHSAAVEHLRTAYLLFHAGAVACGRHGFLLPAPAGRGKTTLVAGLMAAGFGYLGDDIAVVDPTALALLPFGKSLAVKAGARRALARLYPELGVGVPHLRAGGESVWYLPPRPEAWPLAPVPVRYVVLPRYEPRGRTALVPLPRSEALRELLEQSFGIGTHGAAGMAAAVELLRRSDCYALVVGSLRRAVARLIDLAAAAPPAAPAART